MIVNDANWIVIYNSRVMLQIVLSLTDDSRCIIYNCKMFIVQATKNNPLTFGQIWVGSCFSCTWI